MKARIIKIGNSQGIRDPKVLLEQSGLGRRSSSKSEIPMIVIHPAGGPRQGWDEAFHAMAEQGDDQPLDGGVTGQTDWDKNEWQW